MPPATTQTTVPEQNTQDNQSTVRARVTKRTPAERAFVGQVQATDLATPPPQIQVQNIPPPTIPNRTIQTEQNVRQQADGIIRADTEESRQLKQLQNESAALGLDSRGIFEREQQRLGVDKNVRELQDINLQLNDLETQSGLSQVAIAGGAGQTVGQAQRELTQEDQEFAVRSAGLAARSAILQNSIETGRALAKDAAMFATQDVDFKSKQLRAQIDSLSGTVDQQTQQLLDQQKRELDLQDQKSAELRDSIEQAIMSGASQQEIAQFSDPYLDQDTKLDIARKAIGRTASEDRDMSLQTQRLEQANLRSQIGSRQANDARQEATSKLQQRTALLELASAGDGQAIAELGYDPNNLDGGAQAALEMEKKDAEIEGDINVLRGLLDNQTGLETSTGQLQSATLSGFIPFVGDNLTQRSGGFLGSLDARNAKDNFLTDLTYIVNSQTFKSILDIKASGVTFGSMTEGERVAAGRAAERLLAAVEVDETGAVTGIRGSADNVREMINEVLTGQKTQQEEARANTVFSLQENEEINNIFNE